MKLFFNRGRAPLRLVRRYRLELRDGRWRTVDSKGTTFTARGHFIFVRVGAVLWGARCRPYGIPGRANHAEIARGADVAFAGTIRFGNGPRRGILKNWNDASGHYQPEAEFASQAGLPINLFRPYASW